jgi:hypothetical protein
MSQADALAAQAAADLVLYQAGFADGVASVASPTGDVTAAQEQIDIANAVAAAVAPLNQSISSLQLQVSQEQTLLQNVQAAAAAIVAALAPPAPASAQAKK